MAGGGRAGAEKLAMTAKSLALLLQSAKDSLDDCVQEVREAVDRLDGWDNEGRDLPIPLADLERVWAQCQGAQRTLDGLSRRAAQSEAWKVR